MTSGDVTTRPPVAAAAPSNQQTTMTQHYGARSQRQSLPPGWIELTDAASNCPYYFHSMTSRMVLSKAEMFLKSPPSVTPSPAPRTSSPATRTSSPGTVRSLAPEPDHAVSAPVPPTIMEAAHGTQAEPIELSSCSSSVSSSSELTISQTQKMRPTSIQSDDNEYDSEATSY
jgi:hypothetical protein